MGRRRDWQAVPCRDIANAARGIFGAGSASRVVRNRARLAWLRAILLADPARRRSDFSPGPVGPGAARMMMTMTCQNEGT
jgi:hypothetical protein